MGKRRTKNPHEAKKKTIAKPSNFKAPKRVIKMVTNKTKSNHIANKTNNLSPKFDLLLNREKGDLTIAEINVQKIGKNKRDELREVLKQNKIDCLAVTEHHIRPLNKDNLNKSVLDHPSLKIPGYKVISKHRESGSGGVAWYYRKDLDVIPWDNDQIPESLLEASRERVWVKLSNTPMPIALCAVYMPVETKTDVHGDKFQNILNVISADMDRLEREGFKCFLYGDWNAHVGTPQHNPLGIEGNKPDVGSNGERLLTWLEYTDMILVNSLPLTEGLWTYRYPKGLSILDYMICDSHLAQHIKGLIIDDGPELTNIATDHNMIISVLKANHKITVWPKPPPTTQWDTANINKNCYNQTLEFLLRDAHEKRVKNRQTSATKVLEDIEYCMNKALSASTRKISSSPTQKRLPPEIVSMNLEIKTTENQRNRILKDHRGSTQNMDQDTLFLLESLNDKIKELRLKKLEALETCNKIENKKLQNLIKKKQNSSRAFWKLAKPKEDSSTINAVKRHDGSLTTSHTECLEEVQKHFQNLFSPRERPENNEPMEIPKFLPNSHITNKFKPKDVKKALDSLKPGKAPGPDGIPNEVLKLGSNILKRQLCDAFNIILNTGESIPAWAEGQLHLLYKGKGDKTVLSNYRGITVNNTISKVFTSLLNDRLATLAENKLGLS